MRTDGFPWVTPLIVKLQNFARFSQDDRAALDRLSYFMTETLPRRDLVREGEEPKALRLIISGWACQYKGLPDGRRQIVGFFVPGDLCDFNVYILKRMDHSIGAITAVKWATIVPEEIDRIAQDRPRIARALWWNELVNASIQREWLLNIGQRSAYERISHLLVEMFLRMRAVNLTQEHSCEFPLTQTDIAEAAGLTSVHVNRTLQDLRREGLIEMANRRLTIPDLSKLKRAALFNADYLHLDHEGRHMDAND